MSLLAYNLTIAPLPLAAGVPIAVLPASASAGSRGPALNVTSELKGQLAPAFALLQAQVALGQVQYEWTGLPEFSTFSLIVGSAQTDVSDLDVLIYVDPAGSDFNPGTAALPVATYAKALSLVPASWKKQCKIFFAAGTYQIPPGLNRTGVPIGAGATPLCLIGTNTIVKASFADAIGGSNLIINGAFGVTDYTGALVQCLTGSNAGQEILARRNDATTLEVLNSPIGGGFLNPIGAGDTFQIVRPASILENNNATPTFVVNGSGFGFKNLKIRPINGQLNLANVGAGIYGISNLDIDIPAGQFFRSFSNGFYQSIDWPYIADGADNPFSSANLGGLYVHCDAPSGGEVFIIAHAIAGVVGVFVNVEYNTRDCAASFPTIVTLKNGNIRYQGQSTGFVSAFMDGGAMQVAENSNCVPINDNTNCTQPAALDVMDRSAAIAIFCSGSAGNTGVGLKVSGMSQITNIGNSVTGALGDTQVGAVTKAYPALPYGEVDGSGPTLNRIQ